MCELYNRLSALCNQKGVTGAQMCRECGVSKSLMSDLKYGRRDNIATDTAIKLAEYFNVSVEEILKGIKKEPTISEDDELMEYLEMLRSRPECRVLLNTVKGATKAEVEENVRFISAMRQAKHPND